MKKQNMVADASKVPTEDDLAVSATALMVKDYLKALQLLDRSQVNRVLDSGCGFVGVTKLVANSFSAIEVYRVDIDSERLKVAESRGLRIIKADMGTDKLPFPPDHFDPVFSNAVIEHLCFYDNIVTESHRVPKKGGHLLTTWPNLANYIQRISLERHPYQG